MRTQENTPKNKAGNEELEIYDLILRKIKKVNFREKVFGTSPEKNLKLNKKHFIVIVVDELLKTVISNGFELCVNDGSVYLYNGHYWKKQDEKQFSVFLGKVAQKMGVDEFDSKHFGFIDDLTKQFFITAILPKPKHANKVLINLVNGTLEFSEKGVAVREFRSEDFITYQLPFEYNPHAKAPMFKKFIDRVIPDYSKELVLSEFMAYIFVNPSVLKLEKVLMLYGSGANGKSVIYEIINALLGAENVTNYSLEQLTDVNGYYRAMVAGKLLNYCSEIGTRLDSTIFKQMASGEKINARLPYGNPLIIENYAKLIFNSNTLPESSEKTNAYYRRFLIVEFDQVIGEDEQDKELSKKIIEKELSGVLNWVIEGLKRLLEQKRFSHSKAIEKALNNYKTQSDTVRLFLKEEGYKQTNDSYIALQELYVNYKNFCLCDGYKYLTKQSFSNQLKTIGIETSRKQNGMVVYVGRKSERNEQE